MEGFAITAELVAPITEALASGLTTLVPIGIGQEGYYHPDC